MNWISLNNLNQIEEIKATSEKQPVLLFKHSTRCPISSMALERVESESNRLNNIELTSYFLDLIQYREVSNNISETFNVIHQSPQILIIKDKKCIYNNSHMGININNILKGINE